MNASMHHPRCFAIVFVLALVGAAALMPVAARAEEGGGTRAVERTLESGADAVLWPRAGSGTLLITVAVPAGSEDEPVAMAGLSHFLEHLLFDGYDELDERGVTEAFELRSAYVNAFTREQTTVFFALSPREEAIASARILEGMLTRSKIVPATFEKERKVILEELAKDHASASGLEEELMRSTLWQGTPLAHPVGGTEASVAATTHEEVVRYWRERYQPSEWRILITGDLPLSGLEEVLDVFDTGRAAGRLHGRPDPMTWPGWGSWQAVPAPEGEKPAGMGMPSMGMGHAMGGGGGDGGALSLALVAPDELLTSATELEVVARWLADPAGPVAAALVPELAREVTVTRLPREPRDLLEIRVEAKTGQAPEELLARTLGALQGASGGPDDGDVARILTAWTAERALTGQRLHYAAVLYGEALAAARGPLIEALDPEPVDTAAVARAAAGLLTDSRSRIRAAWVGEGGPKVAEALPPAVGEAAPKQVPELADGPFGSRVTTMANGLLVGVLPELGSPVFGVHLLVADRSLVEPAETPGIADLMHRLLPAGSTVSGSSELARRLERAGIEVKAADSPMIPFDDRYHVGDFSYVRLEGPATSLEAALSVLAEMLRAPSWDEAGWQAALVSHEAARKADNRGGARASQAFLGALLGADHPLAKPVSGALNSPLPTEDRVEQVWGRWPSGYFSPDRLILTVASPAPVPRTLEMIADLFSGGPHSEPRRGPYPVPEPERPTTDAVGDEMPQITVLWGRMLDVAEDDRAALLTATNALSDRMVAVIREREGLAYRLGAGVRVLPGPAWVFSARVGTRPENRDRVIELLEEMVVDLRSQPLGADDLTRLAARSRRSTMLRSLAAASRAYRLGRVLFEGPGSTLAVDAEALASVTPQQVQAAARRYLDPSEMVLVVSD